MARRVLAIAALPIVYFALILGTALLVVAGAISEIPRWSPPVFAAVAVLTGRAVGPIRLVEVVIVFLAAVAVFPLGLMYVVGLGVGLSASSSASAIASQVSALEWLVILSPVGAAIITYLLAAKLPERRKT